MELALENPAVLDEATFELDSDFHDFFKEATNEKASVDNVRKYLKNELIKCEETYEYLKEKNEAVAVNLLNGDGNYQILDSDKLNKKADVEKILDPEAGHAFLDSLYRAGKEKGLQPLTKRDICAILVV